MDDISVTKATVGTLTGVTIQSSETYKIKIPCNAPAPLVVNGGMYAGCTLDKDHEGKHEFRVFW